MLGPPRSGLSIGFLTDSLDAIFNGLRDKLTAISPTALRTTIEAAFEEMLDSLQISLLIPPEQIAALDQDYQAVIVGIRRDEEGTRAKERYFSPRDKNFEWNFKDQPPELWDQFKTDVDSYNDAHAEQEPIQVVFNFEMDIAELEAAEGAA